jgi:shikimate dehydrogenase
VLIPPPAPEQVHCAVLGRPIAHSLSPVLHRAAYAELGLDWTYEALDVGEDDLVGLVTSLQPQWRGLSLTMPLKRVVLPLLDELSEVAATAGAANTVVLAGGARYGDNTDVPGAAAALRERYAGPVDEVVVLGGGATAASVLLAMTDLGCTRAHVLVRDPARAADTVAAVARHPQAPLMSVGTLDDPPPAADVLVSTIPATAQTVDLIDRVVHPVRGAVFDVVYDPWPSRLLTTAASHAVLVHGLDLLAHQAALQVQLMTGREVSVDVMRDAGLAALGVGR